MRHAGRAGERPAPRVRVTPLERHIFVSSAASTAPPPRLVVFPDRNGTGRLLALRPVRSGERALGQYNGAAAAGAPSILLGQDSEVRYWTHELGVDEALLRRAIASVGADEIGVRGYLMQALAVAQPVAKRAAPGAESEPAEMATP
jgi:hypothetical protein